MSHGRTKFGPGPLSRIIFFLAGVLAFATFQQAGRSGDFFEFWPAYLALLLVSFGVGWIGQAISKAEQRRQQRQRDQRARHILTEVEAGHVCAYSLYLRGFATTGKMPELLSDSSFELARGGEELLLDLEGVLAEAVEPVAPLLALGHPGEQIGAGRIQCHDDEWQGTFDLLASLAQHIFVLPTASPGTVWEVDYILTKGLVRRCFFLMPPEHKVFGWNDQWQRAIAEVRMKGLRLPEYDPDGMVFTIGEEGTTELTRAFGLGRDARAIREHIRAIMRGIGDEAPEPVLHCPVCDTPYRLGDYRPDAPAIFCSSCKGQLSRPMSRDSHSEGTVGEGPVARRPTGR